MRPCLRVPGFLQLPCCCRTWYLRQALGLAVRGRRCLGVKRKGLLARLIRLARYVRGPTCSRDLQGQCQAICVECNPGERGRMPRLKPWKRPEKPTCTFTCSFELCL